MSSRILPLGPERSTRRRLVLWPGVGRNAVRSSIQKPLGLAQGPCVSVLLPFVSAGLQFQGPCVSLTRDDAKSISDSMFL